MVFLKNGEKVKLGRRVLVIDPTSPEPNRGSFCYMPYLATMGLKRENQLSEIVLMEDFTLAGLDDVQKQEWDNVLIALWSYPQIAFCEYLNRVFKGKALFFGYYPMIEYIGLPCAVVEDDEILYGMAEYPKNYKNFKHLLLSDCDQHIAGDKDIQVVPLFTSYGCDRGCTFCSAAANCKHKRLVLPVDNVEKMLCECFNSVKWNIHFTDEDFLYDTERAYRILKFATSLSDQWQFIALAHLNTLDRFVDFVQQEDPKVAERIWKCMRLFEVGLETASASVAREMHKRGESGVEKASKVWEKCPVPILWLTMTFFPGETIGTINETGRFLKKYGLAKEQMTPRLVTNGTRAGLGQFFQPYHGVDKTFNVLKGEGLLLTHTPMRLVPSFVPDTFIESPFTATGGSLDSEELDFYMDVYGVNLGEDLDRINNFILNSSNTCVGEILQEFQDVYVHRTMFSDICIYIALLARLELIKEV